MPDRYVKANRQFRKASGLAIVAMFLANVPHICSQAKQPIAAAESNAPASDVNIPEFAVVSVKPDASSDGRWKMQFTPDGYYAYGVTARQLLQDAYGTYSQDFPGGVPGWGNSLKFDVTAKVDESNLPAFKSLDINQRRLMLQAILNTRFKLKAHSEQKQVQTYALVLLKPGPNLHVSNSNPLPAGSTAGGLMVRNRPGKLTEQSVTMAAFSKFLSYQVGAPVIDQTGLAGRYDLALDWTPEDISGYGSTPSGANSNEQSSDFPSLWTALKEQLGLVLKAQKGLTEILIVDHLEQPDAN
jgi:uncharacterized protein (TIGR03435 family)